MLGILDGLIQKALIIFLCQYYSVICVKNKKGNHHFMRYFIHLAYRGTAYRGWQRQANLGSSVQQVLENTLGKMTGKTIGFMGCGRTDAGVHAIQYFGHFDYEETWTYDPIERLNRMLPKDISVYELIPVHDRAHSRYDAEKRSYEYHLHTEINPFLAPVSSFYNNITSLDIDAMKIATEGLKNLTDFRHLCLTPDKFNNTFCIMHEAEILVSDNGKQLCFRFTANRFLRSMIRIMVSRLLALGQGEISLDEFNDTSRNNQSFTFRTLAFPEGLHLSRIVYPYLERAPKRFLLLG